MSFLDELLDHSGRQELQRLQSRQRTSLKRSSDAPLPEHKDQCSTTGARTARQELREIRSRSIMRLESCWIGVIALAMVVTGQDAPNLMPLGRTLICEQPGKPAKLSIPGKLANT